MSEIQIPRPKELDKLLTDIPSNKYTKLLPGKRELMVSKPGGFYFKANDFDWLLWRDNLFRYHIQYLEKRIQKHNEYAETWNKKGDKQKR